jgi:hypothetical protein
MSGERSSRRGSSSSKRPARRRRLFSSSGAARRLRRPRRQRIFEQLENRVLLSGLTLNVTTEDDIVDASVEEVAAGKYGKEDKLSLREAILAANAHPGSTIFLPAGTFVLAIPGSDEDDGATGDLDIRADMAIFGDIGGGTIIDASELRKHGASGDRVFHILVSPAEPLVGSFPLTTGNDDSAATLGTRLNDLDTIRIDFGAGDILTISGTQLDGSVFTFGWVPGPNATVGDLVAQINAQLGGNARASLELDGNLTVGPTTPGAEHELSLKILAASSATFRQFPAFGAPDAPHVEIAFVTIQEGRADVGAGLLNEGGRVDLFETTITGNQATTHGPAYFNDGGIVQLVNSPLVSNSLGASTNTDPLLLETANLLWNRRHEVVEAVDEFLINLNLEIEQNFRNAIGQINVPGLGTKLQDAFVPALDAFAEMRTTVSDFLQTVVNVPEPPSDISFTQLVQGALYAAFGLGPSALGHLESGVGEALRSRGLDVQTVGLDILQDGRDSDTDPSPTDILVTLGDDVEGTRWLEFGFHLGQRLVFDVPGFSLDGAISDLIDPEASGFSETVSTILAGVGLQTSSGGLRFDTRWDARLGFGVSERIGRSNGAGVYLRAGTTSNGLSDGSPIEELRFSIDAFAAPTSEATSFTQQLEDVVTTPNWSTTLSLGVLQGRISDGTPAQIKITAPTGLPLSFFGGVDRFNPSLFTLNFGDDVETIQFEIETDLPGYESRIVEYNPFGLGRNPDLVTFMAGLNAAVIAAYQTPLPPVSFTLDFSPINTFFNPDALTTPFLVLGARDPGINHLSINPTSDVNGTTIFGPDAFNFVSGQHEDRRTRGVGFANNSFSEPDGGDGQILEAPLPAQASGVSTADVDFFVHLGGARTTERDVEFTSAPDASVRIFFREILNRNITSLQQLGDKLNELLRGELIGKGYAPDSVRFEIHDGDKFRLVAADPDPDDPNANAPLITVTYAAVDQSKFSVVAAVDVTDPNFDESFFKDFSYDQRSHNRVTVGAIRTAAAQDKLPEVFKPKLSAAGQLRLHVTTDPEDLAATNPDSSPFQSTFLADVAMALPNVEFDIVADVKLDGLDIIKNKRAGKSQKFFEIFQIPTLKFDNIQLDVAGFLENVVVPVAQSAAAALDPFLAVIGNSPQDAGAIFNQPIPVISELLGRNVTVKEILGSDAERAVANFVSGVQDAADIGAKVAEFLQSDEFREAMGGVDKFTFGGLEFVMDPNSPLYFPRTRVPIPTDLKFVSGVGEVGKGSFLRTFVAFNEFAPPGFQVDLFRPAAIVNMLTGNPFNIVSFGLPQIDLEGGAEFAFQFEDLSLDIRAAAAFDSNLRLVYDSLGLERIADAARSGAAVDWTDLLDGLAIQNNPAGFEFGGSVSFVADRVSVTIQETDPVTDTTITVFSATGSLDLGASLGLELLDPNNDGKLRLDEILAVTDGFAHPEHLLCIIDVQGEGHAAGSITVSALGEEVFNVDFSESTGEFSLQSLLSSAFGVCSPAIKPPVLAETVEMDGETILRINTGPFAGKRLNGDVLDAEDPVTRLESISLKESPWPEIISGLSIAASEAGWCGSTPPLISAAGRPFPRRCCGCTAPTAIPRASRPTAFISGWSTNPAGKILSSDMTWRDALKAAGKLTAPPSRRPT